MPIKKTISSMKLNTMVENSETDNDELFHYNCIYEYDDDEVISILNSGTRPSRRELENLFVEQVDETSSTDEMNTFTIYTEVEHKFDQQTDDSLLNMENHAANIQITSNGDAESECQVSVYVHDENVSEDDEGHSFFSSLTFRRAVILFSIALFFLLLTVEFKVLDSLDMLSSYKSENM